MPLNVCGSMDFNTELPSAWVILAVGGRLGRLQNSKYKARVGRPKFLPRRFYQTTFPHSPKR